MWQATPLLEAQPAFGLPRPYFLRLISRAREDRREDWNRRPPPRLYARALYEPQMCGGHASQMSRAERGTVTSTFRPTSRQ